MSGYEYVPTRGDWRRLGPGAETVLAEIYNDAARPLVIRARAVSGLGYFNTEASFKLLQGLLNANQTERLFRRKAIAALGFGFGSRAVDVIAKEFQHEDRFVREAAVHALARIDDQRVVGLLERQLQTEQAEFLRATLTRTLAKLKTAAVK